MCAHRNIFFICFRWPCLLAGFTGRVYSTGAACCTHALYAALLFPMAIFALLDSRYEGLFGPSAGVLMTSTSSHISRTVFSKRSAMGSISTSSSSIIASTAHRLSSTIRGCVPCNLTTSIRRPIGCCTAQFHPEGHLCEFLCGHTLRVSMDPLST